MISFKTFLLESEEEKTQITYPNGVYMAVVPDELTNESLQQFQEKFLKGKKLEEVLHCTLIYSDKPHVDEIEPSEYQAVATFNEYDLFGPNKDILVAKLISNDLTARNKDLTSEYGFVSDFEKYTPHITLAFEAEDVDLNSLPPIEFSIILEGEYVETLSKPESDEDEDFDSKEGTFIGKEIRKAKLKREEEEKEEKQKDSDTEEN